MLAVVPKVRKHDAAKWKRYLRGLWLSGLRLNESMALSWDEGAPFNADLAGKYPAFRILAQRRVPERRAAAHDAGLRGVSAADS